MKQKTLDFLEAHKSEQPSTFTEDAKWRQENEVWLKWSRGIALSIVAYMQANSLSRSDIANKLGVSPQYVSRILSGTTNFSFKSIAEIERKLGILSKSSKNSPKFQNWLQESWRILLNYKIVIFHLIYGFTASMLHA